jgi:hypothetical protein
VRELAPTAGARYLLEREACAPDEAWADYRAAIHTPDARHGYRLRLSLAAPPVLTADAVPADPALEAALTAIAKQLCRQAGKAREDGCPAWPRRVLRWKGPGRGR